MREIEVELELNPVTNKVKKYPWAQLEDMDTILIIKGVGATTARQMAYAFGKRRGWKISGSITGFKTLRVGRVG